LVGGRKDPVYLRRGIKAHRGKSTLSTYQESRICQVDISS
jgi:hypothetical protein